MAINKQELQRVVAEHLSGVYETYRPQGVPSPADIPLGNKAALIEATAVFSDIRQSSDIANAFRRQTAAKMLKAYFDGAVRIARANDGHVRSFNGDGMLTLFVGGSRSNNAVKAAMQTKWFIEEVLWPKFDSYFTEKSAERGAPLKFSAGMGLDDGNIYAVRIGIRGTNDVAWVGRCTNTAAKLSDVLQRPRNIAVTSAVYQRLDAERKLSEGRNMWSAEQTREFGGVKRAYRTTSFRWSVPSLVVRPK